MRRVTRRNRSLARGRMFLQGRLGWLPGFPVAQDADGVVWMPAPQLGMPLPQITRLGREELHRATYTWNKLVNRFPYALPRLVGDYGRWVQGVPRLFSWLKHSIHKGEPLPTSLWQAEGAFSRRVMQQAAQAQKQMPALTPLLNALSWVMFLQPKEATQVFAWLEGRETAVSRLLHVQPGPEGITTILILYRLTRQHGARRVEPVWQFLADQRAFAVTMRGAGTYLNAWAQNLRAAANKNKRKQPPQPPQPQLGLALLAFVKWLALQNRGVCRRALELFGLLLTGDPLSSWQAWWDAKKPAFAKARRLVAVFLTPSKKKEANKLAQKLDIWAKNTPPQLNAQQLIQDVQRVAHGHANLHRPLCALLALLPATAQDNMLLRPALLHHWRSVGDEKPLHAPALLSRFSDYLRPYETKVDALAPWRETLRSWMHPKQYYRWSLTQFVLEELPDQRTWPAFFDALATVVTISETPLDQEDGQRLVQLVGLTANAELAVSYYQALVAAKLHETYLSNDLLRCAYVLDAGRGQFAQLVQQLEKREENQTDVAERVTAVATYLDTFGWTRLAGDLILDNELPALLLAGQKLTALRQLGGAADPPRPLTAQSNPDWCSRYPPRFQPALTTLVGVTGNAAAIANGVLGKQYPDPARLQQQIAVLEEQLTRQPHRVSLAKRLGSLQQRLATPAPVSSKRQTRLQEKLERAVRRTILQTWQQQLDEGLTSHLVELLQINAAPDWLLQPEQLQIFAHLFELPEAFRRLGIRLLRTRCGPPPWNLIEDPNNQAFLARLRRRGINPDPWTHPPAPRSFSGKNGQVVTLAFADDPLQIFHMGGHFNTCLSPGAFNFFSVFANAADINKHVVYAYDGRGQVVGRCLLALTDQGALLTFMPYCHDNSLGFGDMMSQVAEELATAMGTAVLLRGHVPSLVAPDWYDDGPRDLCHRFDFLQAGSSFYNSLAEVELDALVLALEQQFAPLPLNAMTLTLVLHLLAGHERKELIRPLLPLLAGCKELADRDWLLAARLAHQAGAHEFARQALQQRAVPYLLQLHRRHGWLDYSIVEVLVELEPAAALRVLRQTRWRRIRSDADETVPRRRALLAQTLRALGRSKQAAQLQPET